MPPKKVFQKYRPLRRNDRNEIGPVVAKIRSDHELTQEDLAGRCAVIGWVVSRDTVKRIESGEREITDIEIKKLARALRVAPARFFE